MKKKYVLATRSSALALAQALEVKNKIQSVYPNIEIEFLKVKTKGDLFLDKPLREVGGKALFVTEIEDLLLSGEADFAVHSMKDVPSVLPDDLEISCILKREDSSDVILFHSVKNISELKENAKIGTSSLRRSVLLKKAYPQFKIEDLRGNINTRIQKLKEGHYDAIILALAGLKRLNLAADLHFEKLGWICAPGQGAIGIELRKNDEALKEILKNLNDAETQICVEVEREVMKHLEGSCQVPMGAQATLKNDQILLNCFLSSVSGDAFYEESGFATTHSGAELAYNLSQKILQLGGRQIIESLRK